MREGDQDPPIIIGVVDYPYASLEAIGEFAEVSGDANCLGSRHTEPTLLPSVKHTQTPCLNEIRRSRP